MFVRELADSDIPLLTTEDTEKISVPSCVDELLSYLARMERINFEMHRIFYGDQAMLETIQVNTSDHAVMVDVTDLISRKVQASGVRSGLCIVYIPHTTAAVTVNEGADPAVAADIINTLDRLVPWRAGYKHTEGNAAAHIKAMLVGGSSQIIIDNGHLVLGTWERIFLCEFDGPRTRKIRIKILED